MVVPCPICGKLTAIYWPQFWVYRRGETYYCSENCLIVDRTRDVRLMNQVARERLIRKGVEDMGHHKLTLEQKKKAVEIASQGGDQLEYLRKCGAKNPSAAWFYIKKTLEVKETEKKAEQAEKPQLAEVADKVPEAIAVPGEDKQETEKPIIKEFVLEAPAEPLEVLRLKSKALNGGYFNKVEAMEPGMMILDYFKAPLDTDVRIKLNREGWYQLIEEIRIALDQMNI